MKRLLKRIALAISAAVVLAGAVAGVYAFARSRTFDASMDKVYPIAPLPLQRSADPAVIARGKHLADAIAGCTVSFCHEGDLGGGETFSVGPLATFTGPNVSPGGLGAAYADGELARLIRHGVKKDGRSVRLMPAQDFGWLSDADLVAIISFFRSVAPVDRPNGIVKVNTLGKIYDVNGDFAIDVARRIDHEKIDLAPPPSANADYGRYLSRVCTACHGEHLSGGPIPGGPPSFPVPLNLTPHETGLKSWTFEDFDELLTHGIRKNGMKLQEFMPIEAFGKMDRSEKTALFAYLRTLPPTPFGNR